VRALRGRHEFNESDFTQSLGTLVEDSL
jgi:hypothetical protein